MAASKEIVNKTNKLSSENSKQKFYANIIDESCGKRIESKDEAIMSKKSESNSAINKHKQQMNKQHIENNKCFLSSKKLKRFELKQSSANFNHKTCDEVVDEDDDDFENDDDESNEEEYDASYIFHNNINNKNETCNNTLNINSNDNNDFIHKNSNNSINLNQFYDSDNENNQEKISYSLKKITKSNKRKLNENEPSLNLAGLNDADYRNYLLRTMNEILTSQLTLTRKVDHIRDNFSIINNRIKGIWLFFFSNIINSNFKIVFFPQKPFY
jgi:hypothetical protein